MNREIVNRMMLHAIALSKQCTKPRHWHFENPDSKTMSNFVTLGELLIERFADGTVNLSGGGILVWVKRNDSLLYRFLVPLDFEIFHKK